MDILHTHVLIKVWSYLVSVISINFVLWSCHHLILLYLTGVNNFQIRLFILYISPFYVNVHKSSINRHLPAHFVSISWLGLRECSNAHVAVFFQKFLENADVVNWNWRCLYLDFIGDWLFGFVDKKMQKYFIQDTTDWMGWNNYFWYRFLSIFKLSE